MSTPFSPASPASRVAVLGATGAVGQSFIRLLANHPWFELARARGVGALGREDVRRGRRAGSAPTPCPARVARHDRCCRATRTEVDARRSCSRRSTRPSPASVEPAFARAGRMVLSNAKNYRMEPDVPLVIAEVNPDHLELLDAQRSESRVEGRASSTNGNCASIVAALPLAPLHERVRHPRALRATMQAVSGAGYPGVPSLDILGNVIPFIGDEEPKIEAEIQKFLGASHGDAHRARADHGQRAREPRRRSSTATRSACRSTSRSSVDAERRSSVLRDWRGAECARGLPSAPERRARRHRRSPTARSRAATSTPAAA